MSMSRRCLPALFALCLPLAALAVDRDHARSVEAGAQCVRAGQADSAERLHRCCKSTVPTQARQADWDRYTAVCEKAATGGQASPERDTAPAPERTSQVPKTPD